MSLDASERQWLERVFDTFYDKVYAFLLARTGNQALSEDLTSQTFLKIAENFQSYRVEKGALSTWIFTIAINEMNSHYRRQKNLVSVDWDSFPEVPSSDDIAANYEKAETRRELYKMLTALDERSFNLVTLKFFGNLTNREIARILKISVSNVGTILNRELKKLKNTGERCDESKSSAYKGQEGEA